MVIRLYLFENVNSIGVVLNVNYAGHVICNDTDRFKFVLVYDLYPRIRAYNKILVNTCFIASTNWTTLVKVTVSISKQLREINSKSLM